MRDVKLLLAGLAAALAAHGCGRSHDLGVDSSSTTSSSSSSSSSSGTGGMPATTTGTGGAVEPLGPTALTIVNGINDYDAVRFCFLPGDTPWPAAAGGLPFATGQAVDLSSAIPHGADVTPWVIAGDLSATAGKTCSDIISLAQPDGGAPDGGTPVVAAPLGVIPQSVLSSMKSLLLVPTGCMGGAGHDSPGASQGCGSGYSSQTPTTGVVLLAMSRILDAEHVSLQVVSASATLPAVDVRVLPGLTNAMDTPVAPSLSPGAIGPEPPFAQLAVVDYGNLANVQLETYPPGYSTPTSTVALAGVLGASAVGTAGFVNGASVVLVAVGGAPGASAGAFWHALTYAAVKADPG